MTVFTLILIKMSSAKDDQRQRYYILLKEKCGEKREKRHVTSLIGKDKKCVSLLKGEILYTKDCEKDHPEDKTSITLVKYEKPSVFVICPEKDVQEIDKVEADLLLPLISVDLRIKILQEKDKLKFAREIEIGSAVWTTVSAKKVPQEYKGVVKYKGPLPGYNGTMFGVELVDCKGKGSTDGFFKKEYFFHCDKDNGVFVSVDKLSLRKDIKQSSAKTKRDNSTSNTKHEHSVAEYNTPYQLEEAVWVFIKDKPQWGVIKFIGEVSAINGITAGIKMNNPCGKGNGLYYGKQLLTCNEGHAHFTPIENVHSQKEYHQIYSQRNGYEKPEEVLLSDKNKKEITLTKTTISNDLAKSMYGHKIDDPVWVYIEEKPMRGVIKFIGRAPGEKEILAGIDMDNPCGIGDGEYSNKQSFKCETDHAHFTPIENVISQQNFAEMYKSPSGYQNTAQDLSCKDIVEMEGKFANQSEAEVIKEQHEILRKVQEAKSSGNHSQGENMDHSLSNGLSSQVEDKNLLGKAHGASALNRDKMMSSGESTSSQTIHESYNRNFSRNEKQFNGYSHQSRVPHATTHELGIGSMVEVLSKSSVPRYGVIRWTGFVPNVNKEVAGLELEEEMEACTDGTFHGQRYFVCPNRKGFFVHLHNCQLDTRYLQGGNSLQSVNKRLSRVDFGSFKSPVVQGRLVPPPDNLDIYTRGGGPRGIQGHHNSCYLDATLFAAFAVSSVVDTTLLREKEENDIEKYEEVQDVLRDSIVYPLRENGFVRADRVLQLRQLLDQLGSVTGLVGEEKDPEEFLLTLLQQVLKSEPFLKIKSGQDVINEYFYQVFADKDVELVLPSVEELLKRSFHETNLKLAEVPSCLIVQMPRFGKGFKMYKRILPSLTINIGELVYNAPQDCAICGNLAKFHCKDCFTVTKSSENVTSGNFCKECNDRYHSHTKRLKHETGPLVVSKQLCRYYAKKPVEHQEMELFAVVCIETSHYVTFVRCQDKWCFFDSMADRVGSKNGYNIPAVTECPEVVEWLSSEKQNRERIINSDDKELPDKVRRILGDAYMCFYQSKEIAMYR